MGWRALPNTSGRIGSRARSTLLRRSYRPRDTGLAGLYFAAVEAGRPTAVMAAVIPVANDGTRALKALLLGVVSVAAILLGLALIPAWSVRPARASMLLAQWRLHILAAGLSTLVAAALVLLIGTPQV